MKTILALIVCGLAGAIAALVFISFHPASTPPANAPAADSAHSTQVQPQGAAPHRPSAELSLPSAEKPGDAIPTPTRLTSDQLAGHLDANHRNASSLLAAYRLTRDRKLLQEAMEKFPGDPRVGFVAYFTALHQEQSSPEERLKWAEAMKASAPENALGFYLSAREHFKAGSTAQAVEDLKRAATKGSYDDYSLDFIQDTEDAYRSAGYSETAALLKACNEVALPHLPELKKLAGDLSGLIKEYRQAGDQNSAETAMAVGQQLARSIGSQRSFLINQLVGLSTERLILDGLVPDTVCFDGKSVAQRLQEITSRREELKGLGKLSAGLFYTLTEPDLATYCTRIKTLGEESAIRWAVNKAGSPTH